MMTQDATTARLPWRARATLGAFDLLYRSPALYWFASTIPFAGQWRTWQRLALPRLTGHDVLEIGCGPGWLLADMAQAGYRCRAIDASPQMVATTQATLRRRKIAPEAASVVQCHAQEMPFDAASFDCVVSTFPAPYIADPATLRQVRRVLRPGGRLIVVEGAQLLPRGPLLWLCVQVQDIVYGHRAGAGHGSSPLFAPLIDAGLVPKQEVVSAPAWRAYLVIGTSEGH